MRFKIRFAEQIVGLFVIVAVAMLVVVLVLMGINQRWFAKNYYFTSSFPSADGLSSGMPIRFKGFQIGVVDSLSLNQENVVGIRFHIYDTYIDKVTPNSVLELTTSPIGLGGGLSFHPGKQAGPHLPEGSFIPSANTPAGQALIKKGLVRIPQNVDTITKLIGEVGPILQNVNTTLDAMQKLIATANGSINGRTPGTVGGALRTAGNTLSTAQTTLTTADATVAHLNQVAGQISGKVNEVLDNLNAASVEVKRATESPQGVVQGLLRPRGSVATLLNDNNALYDKLTATLASLNKTAQQLQALVHYLNSATPQISGILDQGRQTLAQGKDVLQGIRNNPLIRGGIPKQVLQPTTAQGYRGGGF